MYHIYPHEWEALLEALRRDLRSQTSMAKQALSDADFHRQNARHTLRLLELFNPRGPHRDSYQLHVAAPNDMYEQGMLC